MRTIKDIRHKNLLLVIEELGSQQALADLLDRSHAQINQLVNQAVVSATGNRRSVSEKMAREIEEKTSKPLGWMDTDHSGNATDVFEKDNELTEKAEIEILKMQAEVARKEAELAQKDAEIARKEAEAAKALARAEIAEARLKMCELQINDFQLLKSGLKRAERKLAETELALARAQGEIAGLKKTGEKSKV